MDLNVELYALGEGGRVEPLSIPLAEIVGPNAGILEVLYAQRALTRALEIGDVVRVPGVGRYVALSNGWARVPREWIPPLGPDRRPLPDSAWILPAETVIMHPTEGPSAHRLPDTRRRGLERRGRT